MKNAPTTNSNKSVPDKRYCTLRTLPYHVNTLTAAVLVCMREGCASTGMAAVFGNSTTRLAAVIGYLKEKYNWSFETCGRVEGTKDGRESWVSVYWLSQDTIAAAFEDGARTWIEQVKEASANRRNQANQCRARAATKNAALRQIHRADPRQIGLWGDL